MRREDRERDCLKTDEFWGMQLDKVTKGFHPLMHFQVFSKPNIVA